MVYKTYTIYLSEGAGILINKHLDFNGPITFESFSQFAIILQCGMKVSIVLLRPA